MRAPALFGAGVWLAWLLASRPAPLSEAWAEAIVLLAALVLVPLGLPLAGSDRRSIRAQPWAALALVASLSVDRGTLAGLLALPWLLVAVHAAIWAALGLRDARRRAQPALAHAAGLVFLPVGAGWLFLSRLGVRPLGFSDSIVLLTAVHFHYAGFALPIALGASLRTLARSHALDRIALSVVVLGVPLVAAGITATQLGASAALEPIAALTMAAGGLITAHLQVLAARIAKAQRAALVLSALCLGFGMLLAALYGVRTWVVVPGLDIPWMRVLHGSANAFGFALLALWAWSSAHDAGRARPDAERADEDGDRDGGRGERDEQHVG